MLWLINRVISVMEIIEVKLREFSRHDDYIQIKITKNLVTCDTDVKIYTNLYIKDKEHLVFRDSAVLIESVAEKLNEKYCDQTGRC